MPVEDAPDDDSVRQSYNFAPGYYGLVYRADAPDRGGNTNPQRDTDEGGDHEPVTAEDDATAAAGTRYKLQAMKWGLVPFWTKRNPDYGSMIKTINCRDDSLIEDRGMWTSMKKRKRCIIVAQGFYEWLKKNNGKEKLPHLTKRPDGQLLCFAGLWDCVQYQGQPFSRLYYITRMNQRGHAVERSFPGSVLVCHVCHAMCMRALASTDSS